MKNSIFLLILFNFIVLVDSKQKIVKKSYKDGEKINLISGMVNSFKTQIPYDLYYLDICAPEDEILVSTNLGERLISGKSYQTDYELNINEKKICEILCDKKISQKAHKRITDLIKKEYFVNYFLDNLPAGQAYTNYSINTIKLNYNTGIPIGFIKDNITYINNYFKIIVQLNKINISIAPNKTRRDDDEDEHNKYVNITGYDIVGVNIEPFSIKINESTKCRINKLLRSNNYEHQNLEIKKKVIFRYDTYFYYSNTTYEKRLDRYYNDDKFIHTFSAIISGIIILVLLIILSYIYFRSIKSEIEIHNVKVASEDTINEYGWRDIAFDVFRRPIRSVFFACLFGTGIQLLITIVYSLLIVSLRIILPKNGGSYFIFIVTVYIFLSLTSGYFSSRFYKMVHGINWIRVSILTAIFFPSIFILLISFTNYIYYLEGSTTYIQFKNFYSLIILWVIGIIPLVFIGSIIGITQKRIQFPCEVNPMPGLICKDNYPWYLRIRYAWFLTGFPPFFAVFVELFYIMDSLWKQNFYGLSKYLLISIIILIITSSQIGILFTYLNLCKGDYRWWWKSFIVSASPGVYIIIFSIFYLFKLRFSQFSSILIYLNFMTLLSIIVSLICGTAGFFLTFIFLINIYSKINIT